MKTLGQFIREARDEQDLSLREFAKKVGCSPAFLSDVELGRRYPSDELFSEMAKQLKVSLSEFKKYDTRPATGDLRKISQVDPKYAFAFRTVLENKVSADDLIKFATKDKKKNLKSNRSK